jgi:hypothetical protein
MRFRLRYHKRWCGYSPFSPTLFLHVPATDKEQEKLPAPATILEDKIFTPVDTTTPT